MNVLVILKIIGFGIFFIGLFIIAYPLIQIYKVSKEKPNELVRNVLKDINYSDKKLLIGAIVAIIGSIILVV